MTSIVAALLSGFLNAQQIASLSLVCMAEMPNEDEVVLTCALMGPEGKVVRALKTPVLPASKPVPVPALAAAWCELGSATLSLPGGPPA